MALFVDHMSIHAGAKDIIIFHTCMCVAFTVLINGTLASPFYKKLGLSHVRDLQLQSLRRIPTAAVG